MRLMLAFAFVWLSATAYAHETIRQQKPITVGLNFHTPYVTGPPVSGTDPEIIRAVFRVIGKDVEFISTPSLRLGSVIADKLVDGITTSQPSFIGCTLTDPFNYFRDGVLIIPSLIGKIRRMEDLAGHTVGTFPNAAKVLGADLTPYLASFGKVIDLIGNDVAFKMLNAKRIEAYIGDYWAVNYYATNIAKIAPKARPYEVAFTLKPSPKQLCFHDAALVPVFNAALRQVRTDGTVQKILEKYGAPQPNTTTP